MKIDVIYLEGEHPTTPGIVRSIFADEVSADKETASLLKTGARVYRQTLPLELPAAYTHLEMEAALCVWECLCDWTVNTDEPDPKWLEYRDNHGAATLRHESIEIGKFVLKVYDLLPQWYRESGAYDWEIVPSIVDTLNPGQTSRDPSEARREILEHEGAKAEYLRSFNWYLDRRYGIDVDREEFEPRWYDPDVEPKDQVEKYAEKYGLEKVS